ncbi:MAG: DNA primase [Patescibacteria group bacterium]|nr:MAG: DNA primase [Patescibacteria group bacterium]
MDEVLQQIKQKLDIVDFIGSYIELKRAGKNFKAKCPFHQEKTPSFMVSPERQIWRCFGACQEGGDVISFYMKWENIDFITAVKELAEKLGLDYSRALRSSGTSSNLKSEILGLNKRIANFYSYLLFNSKEGRIALDYLKNKRGLSESIIKKFGIGFSPSTDLYWKRVFSREQISKQLLLKTGVFYARGSEVYDRFQSRIVFPLVNIRSEVVGFSGRVLEDKEGVAKYINTPETEVYHKRESFFGIDQTKDYIRDKNLAYIVEGEFDLIKPYQEGFKNFLAIKGSAITEEQIKLVSRLTDRLVLVFDSDSAGENAAKRTLDVIKDFEIEVYVVRLNFAKDPDEAVSKDKLKFSKALSEPVNIYEFILNLYKQKYDLNSAYGRNSFLQEAAYVFNLIKNPVIYDFYLKKLAEELSLSENKLQQELRFLSRRRKVFTVKPVKDEQKIDHEKILLGIILQSENISSVIDEVFKVLELSDFRTVAVADTLKIIQQLSKTNKELTAQDIFDNLSAELKDFAETAYLYLDFLPSQERRIKKILYYIKILSLKHKIKTITSQSDVDETSLNDLIKQLRQIEQEYLSF